MKRIWPKVLAIGVAVLGAGLLMVQVTTRIPANAGGSVNVEANMAVVPVVTSRLEMLRRLSHELKQNPEATRIRVISRWGACSVSCKRAIVYDRSTDTLLTWSEGHNKDWWFSKLSRVDYRNVSESSIHAVGSMDRDAWLRTGRKAFDFDILVQYGCTKVE